jgi:sugar phosphate isomerase/epimerase
MMMIENVAVVGVLGVVLLGGYDDVLSIENEDVAQEPKAGCQEALGFVRQFLDAFPT